VILNLEHKLSSSHDIKGDALPSPLLDLKGFQLGQIAEVVWDLEPLPASSTKKGRGGMLKAPGLN